MVLQKGFLKVMLSKLKLFGSSLSATHKNWYRLQEMMTKMQHLASWRKELVGVHGIRVEGDPGLEAWVELPVGLGRG